MTFNFKTIRLNPEYRGPSNIVVNQVQSPVPKTPGNNQPITNIATRTLTNPNTPITRSSADQVRQMAAQKEAARHSRDGIARQIQSLDAFKNPLRTASECLAFFREAVPASLFTGVCAKVAEAMTGNANAAEGERLLNENARRLFLLKDYDGNHFLDQILNHLKQQSAHYGYLGELYQVGELLLQGQPGRANDLFRTLPDSVKNGNTFPLTPSSIECVNQCIQGCTQKISNPPTFTFTYRNNIEIPAETLTTELLTEMQALHQLEDLQQFLKDDWKSKEFIISKFNAMHPEVRNLLAKLVWLAHYQPSSDYYFGQHAIEGNPRLLLMITNKDKVSLISQTVEHYKGRVLCQKRIDDVASFLQKGQGKSADEVKALFKAMGKDTQDALMGHVWVNDGCPNHPGYGEFIRDTRSQHFLDDAVAPRYVRELKDKRDAAQHKLTAALEEATRIPSGPVDVSPKAILEGIPGLAQHLPADLKCAVVTCEFRGAASLGGLGSAVEGMVRAFGSSERVIFPLYQGGPIVTSLVDRIKSNEKPEYEVEHQGIKCKVYKARIDGVRCYFIDFPAIFTTPKIYEGDDIRRFSLFQSLAEQVICKMSKKVNPVQLVHCHDAQTGLIPLLLKTRHPNEYREKKTPATLFTFHNHLCPIKYYGDNGHHMEVLSEIGLERKELNSLVEGVRAAHMVTTVSPGFGQSCQTPEFGNEMDGVFKEIAHLGKFAGILNGTTMGWDPRTIEALQKWKYINPATKREDDSTRDLRFGPNDPDLGEKLILIREQLALYMETKLGIKIDPKRPYIIYLGRYDSSQKGIDKLPLIMEECHRQGIQFISIGISPDPEARAILTRMQQKARELGDGFAVFFDDGLPIQKVIGPLLRTCGELIIPSSFEPCCLVDQESLQLGVPYIATAIDGLKDKTITEGPNKNGDTFKRCVDWNSPEQNEEILKTLREVIPKKKLLLDTLYADKNNSEYVAMRKRLMIYGLNSTWTQTPDGTSSPLESLLLARAKAFYNLAQGERPMALANLQPFKL